MKALVIDVEKRKQYKANTILAIGTVGLKPK